MRDVGVGSVLSSVTLSGLDFSGSVVVTGMPVVDEERGSWSFFGLSGKVFSPLLLLVGGGGSSCGTLGDGGGADDINGPFVVEFKCSNNSFGPDSCLCLCSTGLGRCSVAVK